MALHTYMQVCLLGGWSEALLPLPRSMFSLLLNQQPSCQQYSVTNWRPNWWYTCIFYFVSTPIPRHFTLPSFEHASPPLVHFWHVYCCLLPISASMQTPIPTDAHCYSGNEMEIKATNCIQTSHYGDNCKAHPTPALIHHSLNRLMPFCFPA